MNVEGVAHTRNAAMADPCKLGERNYSSRTNVSCFGHRIMAKMPAEKNSEAPAGNNASTPKPAKNNEPLVSIESLGGSSPYKSEPMERRSSGLEFWKDVAKGYLGQL